MGFIGAFGIVAFMAAGAGAVGIKYYRAIKALINSHPIVKVVAFIVLVAWLTLLVAVIPGQIAQAKFNIGTFIYSH